MGGRRAGGEDTNSPIRPPSGFRVNKIPRGNPSHSNLAPRFMHYLSDIVLSTTFHRGENGQGGTSISRAATFLVKGFGSAVKVSRDDGSDTYTFTRARTWSILGDIEDV